MIGFAAHLDPLQQNPKPFLGCKSWDQESLIVQVSKLSEHLSKEKVSTKETFNQIRKLPLVTSQMVSRGPRPRPEVLDLELEAAAGWEVACLP